MSPTTKALAAVYRGAVAPLRVRRPWVRPRSRFGASALPLQHFRSWPVAPGIIYADPEAMVSPMGQGLTTEEAQAVLSRERVVNRDTDGDVCGICMEDWADGAGVVPMPNCAHCLHPECVRPWLAVSQTCPCCRASTVPATAAP